MPFKPASLFREAFCPSYKPPNASAQYTIVALDIDRVNILKRRVAKNFPPVLVHQSSSAHNFDELPIYEAIPLVMG